MKSKLVASLLAIALGLSTFAKPSLTVSATQPDWNEVHAYISAHATYVSPTAEAELFTDIVLGTETWETLSGSSARKAKDNMGLGWPSTGSVIVVPSNAEEAALADLIRRAASGG